MVANKSELMPTTPVSLPPLNGTMLFLRGSSTRSGHLALDGISGLRRGNCEGIGNTANLRLNKSRYVVVLLLWDLQHNRVQI